MRNGRLTIVWDGINEARCENIDDVFQDVLEFATKHPGNRYFLSCRTAEFPPWVRAYIEEFHLLPVTEDQLSEQFSALLGPEDGGQWLRRLASRDTGWLHLRELCGNPLLLTMVIATVRDSGSSALEGVQSKANLYRAFLDTLYERETEKPKDAEWRRILPSGLREILLGAVAHRMQASDTVAVEEPVLQQWLQDEFKRDDYGHWWGPSQRPSIPKLLTSISSRPPFRVIEDLPSRVRHFAFLHQSFGEYYAAIHYERTLRSGEMSWSAIDALAADTSRRNWEVLELLAGLLRQPETLVSRITSLATKKQNQVLLILAARCVRAAPNVPIGFSDDVRIRMIDAFKNWGKPFDYELIHAMAEALSEVGGRFPVRLRDDFDRFTSKYSHIRPVFLGETTLETLKQLCLDAGGSAINAAYTLGLRRYANDEEKRDVAEYLATNLSGAEQHVREQMIAALKEIAHPCSLHALISIIRDGSESPWARAYALNAVGAICDLSAVGAVVEYLKNLSNTYRDSASWSLQMLGRRAKEVDDKIFGDIKSVYIECLKNETEDIEGRYCKGNIVYSLGCLKATEYVDDILEWLVAESDPYVIEDGVQALGLLGDPKGARTAHKFLNDDDPVVRMKAAETLGRLGGVEWADDIRVLKQNDEFPVVREAAESALQLVDVTSDDS